MEKAKEIYAELKTRKIFVESAVLAIVAAALGYNNEALQFAHRGFEKHDPYLVICGRTSVASEALRALPGFAEMQRKMTLISS